MDDLQAAWVSFLSHWRWQIFYTQTFEDQPRFALLALDRARRIFEVLRVRYKMDKLFVFACAEQHKSGAFHVHGLAIGKPDIVSLQGSLRFLWLYGREKYGLCRYETLDSIGVVTGNVSKYLTKKAYVEYDFFGDIGWKE